MKSKTLVGGLVAAVVTFLLGWLVFGILLKDYYSANQTHYDSLIKVHPVMWALIIANLAWGLLLAYVMDVSGANTIGKGFICGFIVFFLVTLGVDMFFVAFMNLMKIRLAAVDTAVNALLGGVAGAIVGWAYSLGKKAAV